MNLEYFNIVFQIIQRGVTKAARVITNLTVKVRGVLLKEGSIWAELQILRPFCEKIMDADCNKRGIEQIRRPRQLRFI